MIRGPAIIGAARGSFTPTSGRLRRSCNDVEISDTEIEHSIVLEGSCCAISKPRHRQPDRQDVRIHRVPLKPSAYRFMLGDNSEVGIRW